MANVSKHPRLPRWRKPFDPEMKELDVARALAIPILETLDPRAFSPARSLYDLIRNDARIRSYQRGDVVVCKGDFGSSVFFVLRGSVRVIIEGGSVSSADFAPLKRKQYRGVFGALGRMLRNPRESEVRDVDKHYSNAMLQVREEDAGPQRFLGAPDTIVESSRTIELGRGQIFGEIAALSRTPRISTVFVDDEHTELLELRWQGLREIRKRDKAFRDWIDRLYKQRALATHLAESPLFANLDEEKLQAIAYRTEFEQYGESEWHLALGRKHGDIAEQSRLESPIVESGHYVNGLILVRSGLARITGSHRQSLGCIRANGLFGLEEIMHGSHHGGDYTWRRGLYAMGYVDILRIPTHLVEKEVLPTAPPELLDAARKKKIVPVWSKMDPANQIDQSLLDFFVDQRIVNGRKTMLIDTWRCTGCDDCVRACAAGHDNNPRFRRHGPMLGGLMVANACMHCSDPVCLIGCPTGAIHREPEGQVTIDDTTCIGCGRCAESCPYDNIVLVPIRDRQGALVVDEADRPVVKATKCDLCIDLPGGPACQRACPHDALTRLDANDYTALHAWISRR